MDGGQDKPAWTACPPGVKITRVGGKITRDSLPPGGQAVQGGKITRTLVKAQLDACTTGIQEVAGSILRSGNSLLWRLVTKSFLRPLSPYH